MGLTISIAAPASRALSNDEHFPQRIDREYEEHLLALCASGDLEPRAWRALGPAFFMAGVAVMLASVSGFDRRRLLALAETLHPGSSLPEVFAIWLARGPVRPSRFLPMLAGENQTCCLSPSARREYVGALSPNRCAHRASAGRLPKAQPAA